MLNLDLGISPPLRWFFLPSEFNVFTFFLLNSFIYYLIFLTYLVKAIIYKLPELAYFPGIFWPKPQGGTCVQSICYCIIRTKALCYIPALSSYAFLSIILPMHYLLLNNKLSSDICYFPLLESFAFTHMYNHLVYCRELV